jgi:hypothetical protein
VYFVFAASDGVGRGGAAALQLGDYVLDVFECIYFSRLASSSNIF